jgi:putative ABC transport system permease protein
MGILQTKRRRNLWQMKGQVLAIVAIIACGVASLVTLASSYRSLEASKEAYFRRHRMADVFAPVKRAPRRIVQEVRGIPGVRRAQGRIVFDVTLDLPAQTQPTSGRVISVPDRRVAMLCDLRLRSGGWFDGDGTRQVIISESFANEHDLHAGDALLVVMNDKKEALRIVGTAISPEYVYMIGAGEMVPDPKYFTILWTTESFAESVFGYEDACNDILLTLTRDAQSRDVIAAVDDVLDPYGGLGAYERKDQLSTRFVEEEIAGLRVSSTIMPSIFLVVAALVLNVLLGRLIRTERTQIGVLRAFGYTRPEIVRHYLGLAVVVGFLGGVLGIGLGAWFSRSLLQLYQRFFNFPLVDLGFDPFVWSVGMLASLGAAIFGALRTARSVSQLSPAEAMRPPAPPQFGRTLVERLRFLWRHLGFVGRITIRNIARARGRTFTTIGGVALSAAIVLLSFFGQDAMGAMVDAQYRLVERQDVSVAFHAEHGRDALFDLRRMPGVLRAEPELVVPVRLRNDWRDRRMAITGLEPDQTLLALLDREHRHVALPTTGLLLSRQVAKLLGLAVGDDVDVEVLTGRKQQFTWKVHAVVDEYLGVFAYARLDELSHRIGESYALTGARLRVEQGRVDELGTALKNVPGVAGVGVKSRVVESFRELVQESQSTSNWILMIFAGVITFGVIYNAARVSLAERERELASMRVLGLTQREVASTLTTENVLLALLGLLPGIALGLLLCYWLTDAYSSDLYRLPFVVRPLSVFWTAMVVLVFTVLVNVLIRRQLGGINMVEALKARE